MFYSPEVLSCPGACEHVFVCIPANVCQNAVSVCSVPFPSPSGPSQSSLLLPLVSPTDRLLQRSVL